MRAINTASLAQTLDALNEAFFFGRTLPRSERESAARWIASRQGAEGSYCGMFAPTARDFTGELTLFTGEKLRTRVGRAHILGEEASRALLLLDVPIPEVDAALDRSTDALLGRLKESSDRPGMYCCGTCSVSLWRHMAVKDTPYSRRLITDGMKSLKLHRRGEGKWRRFPFYYSLLALDDIGSPTAREEMLYSAPVLERVLSRPPRKDKFSMRRRALAGRILEKCR